MTTKDLRIDGDIATWDMRYDGDVNGTYIGTFKFRCYITPIQQIAAGREERDLLGPHLTMATEHERFLAYALTQLKQRIVSAPPFWSSVNPNSSFAGDIADEELIAFVLDAAVQAEILYKQQMKERRDKALGISKTSGEAVKAQESAKVTDEGEDEE